MAANKFATMLKKKTNKITLILVYALLEWILILLLLINSFFSYIIVKFANYFGLKTPCLLCSRLDHLFDPVKFHDSYRSLVCETHALEISKLGYCLNHKKLAESHDMCEDCLLSSSSETEVSKEFAFFPWMQQLGVVRDCCDQVSDDRVEVVLNCSCCGGCLDRKLGFSDYCLIKDCWGDSECKNIGDVDDSELVFEMDDGEEESGSENMRIEIAKPVEETGEEGFRSISKFGCNFFVGAHGDNVDVNVMDNLEKLGVEDVDRAEEETVLTKERGMPSSDEMVVDNGVKVDTFVAEERGASGSVEMVGDDGDQNVDMDVNKEVKLVNEDVLLIDPSCDESVAAQVSCSEDIYREMQPQHLEFFIDQEDCHLIPVESMESIATESEVSRSCETREEGFCNEDFILELDEHLEAQYELVPDDVFYLDEEFPLLSVDENEAEHETEAVEVEARELRESDSSLKPERDLMGEDLTIEHVAVAHATEDPSSSNVDEIQVGPDTSGDEMNSDHNQGCEEVLDQRQSGEIEPEVSIGTEIPDQEPIDDIQIEDVHPFTCTDNDPLSDYTDNHAYIDSDPGFTLAGADLVEFRIMTRDIDAAEKNDHLSLCPEGNDAEEDRFPNFDNLHHVHKELLILERGESLVGESLDGKLIGDIEGDGVMTVEKLKSALRAQKKALNALYAELEEERSASAVAANETMAMINRLQEEKATMQMEALQYQRMMEEQSDYDQEALQLMNELMVKREKEKAELEKELDVYRKRVLDYELRERMEVLRGKKDGSSRTGTSSASSSNDEDSDGVSVDLNHEMKLDNSLNAHQEFNDQKTPIDEVLYVEESLSNFEEERLAILDQLKLLEEKLFNLNDAEEHHFEDIKPIEVLHEENGYDDVIYENGHANGHYKSVNGKHHHLDRKGIAVTGKRLLPLFDAADAEGENRMVNGHSEDADSISSEKPASKFNTESKKLAIEDEVDYVYERLQVLEADGEFLKHCITSVRKGDKGIELLQEILHHLRALRSMELRVRNTTDGFL